MRIGTMQWIRALIAIEPHHRQRSILHEVRQHAPDVLLGAAGLRRLAAPHGVEPRKLHQQHRVDANSLVEVAALHVSRIEVSRLTATRLAVSTIVQMHVVLRERAAIADPEQSAACGALTQMSQETSQAVPAHP
jgi:hypothetical protein